MSDTLILEATYQLSHEPDALAIANDHKVVIAATGKRLIVLEKGAGESKEIPLSGRAASLSVNESQPIVAVNSRQAEIPIFNYKTGRTIQRLSRKGVIGSLADAETRDVAISPDGKQAVTTTDGSRIFVSGLASGEWEHIMFVKHDGCDVEVDPSNSLVLFYGAPKPSELSGQLSMFQIRRGLQPLWTASHQSNAPVKWAKFSPDGKRLATCGAGDGVRLWNAENGDELEWRPPESEPIQACWFTHEDRVVVIGKQLSVYSYGDRKPAVNLPSSDTKRIAVSPDGRTFVVCEITGKLNVWRIR